MQIPRSSDAPPPPDRDPLVGSVRCVAAGDTAALRTVYEATVDRVVGIARRITGDDAAADEVAVDTYEKVWRLAPGYDEGRGSVLAWVVMIARSLAMELRRTRARLDDRREPLPRGDAASEPGALPDDAASSGERAAMVRSALRRLPDDQRRCVVGAFFDGLTHTQMAHAFDTPLGTIKSRVRAGLATLRTSLVHIEQETG